MVKSRHKTILEIESSPCFVWLSQRRCVSVIPRGRIYDNMCTAVDRIGRGADRAANALLLPLSAFEGSLVSPLSNTGVVPKARWGHNLLAQSVSWSSRPESTAARN